MHNFLKLKSALSNKSINALVVEAIYSFYGDELRQFEIGMEQSPEVGVDWLLLAATTLVRSGD